MALIQVQNPTQATPPQDIILDALFNVTFTEEFSAGQTITCATVGSGIMFNTMTVNYMQKPLMQGVSLDYTFTGPDTITLNFGDDPTQYANGEIILQISYTYYA